MLDRPALYKKFQQRTSENKSNRFRTNLDPFIGVFMSSSGNSNEADTQLTVVMFCQIFTRDLQGHPAVICNGGHAAQGLWIEHQSAGELLVFQSVFVFFYQKKNLYNLEFYLL